MGTYYIAGDFLGGPGTGALGGPPVQHNYKRAVCRPPPHDFAVEVLPPTKFGSGYCYGMRICPLHSAGELPDNKSGKSSKSGGSHSEYEVWRRWEDCLWFQDILESEYSLMARTKRQRLAAGKGVKKNGVYIHSDQAASFESLPPGPEASSVAKDVHDIIPRLTKKGTFFRASQATVDQRGKEFQAMIDTLFSDDVPTLIKELRETRLVRDFFGYWRRDKDHDRKVNPRPGSGGGGSNARASVASSAFSLYFSASNISLQIPSAQGDLLPSPAPPESATSPPPSRRESVGMSPGRRYAASDSTASSSSVASLPPHPFSPAPTAAGMPFLVSARGSVSLTPGAEDALHPERPSRPQTAPSRMSSKRWSHDPHAPFVPQEPGSAIGIAEVPIVFMPDGQQWSDRLAGEHPAALQALPEDQELVPAMAALGVGIEEEARLPPRRRSRNNSCPDRANRNCVIFMTPPHSPTSAEHGGAEAEADGPRAGADALQVPLSQSDHTMAGSSRPSSMALSSFSANVSRRSSWRTSMASDMSVATGISSYFPRDSCIDINRALERSPVSLHSPLDAVSNHSAPSHLPRASVATMNSLISNSSVDAVLPRRASPPPSGASLRRSFSAGSRRPPSFIASMPSQPEEVWYDQQDDLIDAYFYDPSLRSASPVDPVYSPGREQPSKHPNAGMATPERFPKPFQDRPPGQFHLPWSPPDSPPSARSLTGTDTFAVKAMLDDSIVLLRATPSTTLVDLRARIRDKFARQEGVPLSESFRIGYLPPSDGPVRSRRGRARSNSVSTVGSETSQAVHLITSEEEWQTAIANCAGKLTIRIFHIQP
ncbi:hypothetical protein AcV5_008331 [Taiwanofungus camphoratus]|nr:hypothetical protein AcV5_008331 [Antrodia cinnamomea]